MNRMKNKFHRDIRDIVELSPEARRILDKIEKTMKELKEQTNTSTEESNKGEPQ